MHYSLAGDHFEPKIVGLIRGDANGSRFETLFGDGKLSPMSRSGPMKLF